MNQTITKGNKPTVRASRALRPVNVRRMCVRALELARRKSLTLAVISTLAVFAGVILGIDPLICISALVAFGLLYLADNTKKGGAE